MSTRPPTRETGAQQPPRQADHPLPRERAFVVQLSGAAVAGSSRLSGRVEHVVSGKSARFESLEELLAFVGQWLAPAS